MHEAAEDAVPGLGSKQPGLGSPHLNSKQEAEPEVWTLPDAPSPASSRSSLFRTAIQPFEIAKWDGTCR